MAILFNELDFIKSADVIKNSFTVTKWFRTDRFINGSLVCSPVLLFNFLKLGYVKKLYIDGKLVRTRWGVL